MRANPALIVVPVVMTGLLALMLSPMLMARPAMPLAVAADLVVTLPVILIALSWRNGRPVGSLPLVLLLAAVSGAVLLPPDLSRAMAWIAGGAAVALVAALCRRAAERVRPLDPVRFFHEDVPCQLGNGWIGRGVASGLATLTYAISPPRGDRPPSLTVHLTSGARAFYGALIAVIALETVPVHIGLHLLSPTLAWVVTASSVLMGVAILGHLRGLGHVGHSIDAGVLRLRSGCANHVAIPVETITEIRAFAEDQDAAVLAHLPPLERPNLIVELDREVPIYLGQRPEQRARRIAFHADGAAEAVRLALD